MIVSRTYEQLKDAPDLAMLESVEARDFLPAVAWLYGVGLMSVVVWLFVRFWRWIGQDMALALIVGAALALLGLWLIGQGFLYDFAWKTDAEGISARSLLRKRRLRWDEVESVRVHETYSGHYYCRLFSKRMLLEVPWLSTHLSPTLRASVWQHLRRISMASELFLPSRATSYWDRIPEEIVEMAEAERTERELAQDTLALTRGDQEAGKRVLKWIYDRRTKGIPEEMPPGFRAQRPAVPLPAGSRLDFRLCPLGKWLFPGLCLMLSLAFLVMKPQPGNGEGPGPASGIVMLIAAIVFFIAAHRYRIQADDRGISKTSLFGTRAVECNDVHTAERVPAKNVRDGFFYRLGLASGRYLNICPDWLDARQREELVDYIEVRLASVLAPKPAPASWLAKPWGTDSSSVQHDPGS